MQSNVQLASMESRSLAGTIADTNPATGFSPRTSVVSRRTTLNDPRGEFLENLAWLTICVGAFGVLVLSLSLRG